jgi:hypothetical protein
MRREFIEGDVVEFDAYLNGQGSQKSPLRRE